MNRVYNQRVELRRLNERCQALSNKLLIIERVDYIKSRLSSICPDASYRDIIMNGRFRADVCEIFKLPFQECMPYYNDVIDRRNKIVHRFTSSDWDYKPRKRKLKRKTLEQLANT